MGASQLGVLPGHSPRLSAMTSRSASLGGQRSEPLGMSLMQEPVRVLVRCALPGPMRVTQGHIKPHAPRRSCQAEPDRCPSPTSATNARSQVSLPLIDNDIVNLDDCVSVRHVEQHREPGRALHECAECLCPRCQWTDRSSPHTSSCFDLCAKSQHKQAQICSRDHLSRACL